MAIIQNKLEVGHSLEYITHTGNSIVEFNNYVLFALCDPVTLTF